MRFVDGLIIAILANLWAASGKNVCLSDGRCSAGSQTLKLNGCHLSDDDMGDIAECIAEARSAIDNLHNLDLLYNNSLGIVANDTTAAKPPGLERLFLNENDFVKVPQLELRLKGVYYLRLDGNHISALATGDFSGFPKLEQLYLNNNSIAEIPASVLKIRNLFYLNLADNNMTVFPAAALEKSRVRYLYLTGNPHLPCAPTTKRKSSISVDDGLEECELMTCDSLGVDGIGGRNQDGNVCCPRGCTKCGGTGCRSVGLPDFDRYDCCIQRILEAAQFCETDGSIQEAPCILRYRDPE